MPRLLVWAGLGVAWIVGIALAARRSRAGLGLPPTDSLVERFGLCIIIVLGEVVMAITAAGAGMVSLIGHAHDPSAPASTSRLLSGGAAAALVVGWLRPAPWLLALVLVAVLAGVWCFAVSRFLRADAWREP
jgi:hypothetical protein